jgi:polysaccharide export outer membrane protein
MRRRLLNPAFGIESALHLANCSPSARSASHGQPQTASPGNRLNLAEIATIPKMAGTMTLFRSTLLSIWLLPALVPGLAQQVGKPVLAVDPPAASATEPTAPPSAGPSAVTANYIIGPEDSLQITVWREPTLSATLPVRPDGKISLPLIGDIPAAGFTPMQLAADITTRLKQFVTDPVVDVTVLAVNSKHVFLIGEIMHVGPLAITPGMTILQAIATAGGLTPYANKKHIYILRGDPGHQQKIPFDYTRAVKKGDMQGVALTPNDTIVVP